MAEHDPPIDLVTLPIGQALRDDHVFPHYPHIHAEGIVAPINVDDLMEVLKMSTAVMNCPTSSESAKKEVVALEAMAKTSFGESSFRMVDDMGLRPVLWRVCVGEGLEGGFQLR